MGYEMNRANRARAGMVMLVVVIVFLAVSCNKEAVPAVSKKEKKEIPVRIVAPEIRDIHRSVELTGSVAALRIARVASPAEGPVARLFHNEGDWVNAGDTILVIGRIAGIEAELAALEIERKHQDANLERVRRLVEGNYEPLELLEKAETAHAAVLARIAVLNTKANDYSVIAPFSGFLTSLQVREGSFVSPRNTLVELYDPESCVVRTAVSEDIAMSVHRGQAAKVRLDAYPDTLFAGRVTQTLPFLDSRMHTRSLDLSIPGVTLLPGMFARISIVLESREDVLCIPEETIDQRKGQSAVYLEHDGKAVRHAIKTGMSDNGWVEVLDGLTGKERVISGNIGAMSDHAAVRVMPEPGKPVSAGSGKP